MFDHDDPLNLSAFAVDPGIDCDNIFESVDDFATGFEGGETFTVFDVEGPDAPAVVTDFDPDTDVLYIQYCVADEFDADHAVPELAVSHDGLAGVTRITLDGKLVATVESEAMIDPADITLVPMP